MPTNLNKKLVLQRYVLCMGKKLKRLLEKVWKFGLRNSVVYFNQGMGIFHTVHQVPAIISILFQNVKISTFLGVYMLRKG